MSLKSQAKAHGRSLNKEIIAALTETLRASCIDATTVAHEARAVRETMGVYLTQADLASLKDLGRQ